MPEYEFEVDVTKRRTIRVEDDSQYAPDNAIEEVALKLNEIIFNERDVTGADIHNYREIRRTE